VANEGLTGGKREKVMAALDANWQAEMEGHQTYQTLAERDSDPVRAQVLHHLAGAEWEHAALWAGRIRELDGPEPVYKGRELRTHWPTAPAASEWPCVDWRSTKAATLQNTASN
jgi:Mn-containing catalase